MEKLVYLSHVRFPSSKANAAQSLEMAKALSDRGALAAYVCFGETQDDGDIRSWARNELGIELEFPITVLKAPDLDARTNALLAFNRLVTFASKTFGKSKIFFIRDYRLFLIAWLQLRHLVFESHQWSYYNNEYLNRAVRTILVNAFRSSRTEAVVSISDALRRRWISKGAPPEKSIALHDGVDENFFSDPPERSRSRKKTGLPDRPLVLYAGSLYKNRSIEWFPALAADIPSTNIVVIGGNPSEAEEWNRKSLHTNLRFISRISRIELKDYLYSADVLVFSMSKTTRTFDICSPLKIFEYMAAGKIVVAPDLPNLREVLAPEYSELYEIDDYQSFAAAVRRSLERQTQSSWSGGTEGRRRALSEYSWTRRAELLMEMLDCSRRTKPAV